MAPAELAAPDANLTKELPKLLAFTLSAIGLCYDVGYFSAVDLGYYSIFSFTEHLVFALEAIPFAFVFGIIFFLLLFIHSVLVAAQSDVRRTRIQIGEGLVCVVAVPFLHVYAPDTIALFFLLVGIGCWLVLWTKFRTKLVVATYAGLVIAAVATAAGHEQAMSEAFEKLKTDAVHTDDRVINGRIIRSGESRFLFYDAENKLVTVLKWDDVKRITTPLDRGSSSALETTPPATDPPRPP